MAIVNCETCGNELKRNNSQIKASKNGIFFCNRECRSKWDKKKFENRKVEFKCPVCNKIEMLTKSEVKNKKFCSLKCLGLYKTIENSEELKCDYCGKKFLKRKSLISKHNFCTKKCSEKQSSKNNNKKVYKKCIICDKEFLVGRNRKNIAKTCSKECHYEYIKDISNNGHMAERLKKNGIKTVLNQKKNKTLPEIMVEEYFNNNGIRFESQKLMYNKFIVDFYLPEYDMVIEVFGDYWHCNPSKYGYEEGKKEPNKYQIRQMSKDKARKNYLTKCGHKFVILWEDDIYKNLEETIKQAIR